MTALASRRKGTTLSSGGRLVLLARRRARDRALESDGLTDVQGIDGVATPCIRGRGAGNATYGSFSTAC